jgi:predicted esterase
LFEPIGMTIQETDFNFKARYYKLGAITSQTKKVWFVIHGYGQLAQYFIKKFSVLEDSETCIISPEGLSRFYLEDVTKRSQSGNNKVGATWMTRENRLMDIENYLTYLNGIYLKEIPVSYAGQVTLLGFSQGGATVSRWALDGKVNFHRLILWAGLFPNDMDFDKGTSLFKDKEVIEVYGDQDPFLTDDRLGEMKDLNKKLNLEPTLVQFKGGHEIDQQTLLQLR